MLAAASYSNLLFLLLLPLRLCLHFEYLLEKLFYYSRVMYLVDSQLLFQSIILLLLLLLH
jgi:hypothetical protein